MNKVSKSLTFTALTILFLSFVINPALAEPNFDSIADKLVNASLAVQPGETVLITGSPSEIKLMEALYVSVSKAGGQPVVQLNLPNAAKRAIMETPEQHLKIVPTSNLILSRAVDCQINVISIQDPTLFSDVPEERLSISRQASATLNQSLRLVRTRNVSLGQSGGIPTKSFAESQGADYQKLTDMFWRAVDIDPDQIAQKGRYVTGMLTSGQTVTVTSGTGTNLTFQIDNIPARLNAARTSDVINPTGASSVWLPAGEAYACVKSSTATGTVLVPYLQYRGIEVHNLKMTYQNGKLTQIEAEKNGDVIKKYLDSSSPNSKNLSIVDLGLNPQSQAVGRYLSYEMAGVVSLVLGNNAWAGGNNDADAALTLFLPNANVSIGGKSLVKNGKLEVPEKYSSKTP